MKKPVVITNSVDEFFKRDYKDIWAYYCCGPCDDGYSNRFMAMPSGRNRITGFQLYKYGIKGFLHWGYNFYYDLLSYGLFDPKTEPCHYNGANPATAFMVYPATNGDCIQSIRQKIFYDGLNDIRALRLLESLIGRDATYDFVKEHYGDVDFHTSAESEEKFLAFREALNDMIKNNI